ncbi:hypothetical protein DCAR_0626305 [Daucus carota subsp. sativus]|uniref:WRKY domain-containing protein n=1 Tax=Daucus carota subsp. sativus TaxID=79200 RepID=A0AAF1B878_DAUCS|nr:hypothetical protein DCAR_0626305 [Daucus carota subsp. sativus]
MAVEVDVYRGMNNYINHSIRRTGHARFRRGPADQSTTSTSSYSHDDQAQQKSFQFKLNAEECKSAKSSISSEVLLIAGEEATVSNGKLGALIGGGAKRNYSSAKPPLPFSQRKISPNFSGSSAVVPAMKSSYSSAKPPLPSTHRKRRREIEQIFGDRLSSHGCHCCKRRKKIEITRRIRILKGSSSLSIPSDEYSWKKYDHKSITGSSLRGGYYKCNSVTGCSARKHVIKDKNDSMVLIVTYKGEHNHRSPGI